MDQENDMKELPENHNHPTLLLPKHIRKILFPPSILASLSSCVSSATSDPTAPSSIRISPSSLCTIVVRMSPSITRHLVLLKCIIANEPPSLSQSPSSRLGTHHHFLLCINVVTNEPVMTL